jgi:SAM-dependent methyltransferase
MAEAAAELRCTQCGLEVAGEGGIWRFAPELRPPGFPPTRREHLEALEREHFWFPPRRRLLASLLDTRVRLSQDSAALDLGCGTGGFLPELARRCQVAVGLDAYEESLTLARRRAPAAVLVQGDVCSAPLADRQFELIVALDVLEHVPAAAFLGEAARLATAGGALLLSVPALPALWSELDEAAGHRCRYTLRRLAAELADAGWRLLHWTHYQFLLLPLVWLARRVAPLRRSRLERRTPRWLGRVLGGVDWLEASALSGLRLPWGSSLMAVARRAP